MTNITLTSSMRSNLLSLRSIATQMDKTQERLSTGMKVNSAIDNASNFYQSRVLTNRAVDLNNLLDAMGQGIQTIQAAIISLESGAELLAQADAVANLALSESSNQINKPVGDAIVEIADAGIMVAVEMDFSDYKKITAGMDATDIEALLEDNAKLVLEADIDLEGIGINITHKNVTIDGNGHKIILNNDNESALKIDGGSVTVRNLDIDVKGVRTYGINVLNGGTLNIDGFDRITTSDGARCLANGDTQIYDGKGNTALMIEKYQNNLGQIPAFEAVNNYSVTVRSEYTGNFAAESWYLPSIGELQQVSENIDVIKTAITTAGGDANLGKFYWSSSESNNGNPWVVVISGGDNYDIISKDGSGLSIYARGFQLVENCFNPQETPESDRPQVGYIMYDDKTWSESTDLIADKVAVGVVTNVSESGDVTVMALQNAKHGTGDTMTWGPTSVDEDFLNNCNSDSVSDARALGGTINIIEKEVVDGNGNTGGTVNPGGGEGSGGTEGGGETEGPSGGGDGTGDIGGTSGVIGGDIASYQAQFNSILNEYDALIKDSSYQGINLLIGGKLDVIFNEIRSNKFSIQGKNISTLGLELKIADWKDITAINNSTKELQKAIDTLRSYMAELGNNYSIIQTRENFTDALTDVLETGANMLVLADMNEESAKYLMLQTRQQLAVNSLSLAAQSASSVLSLF